MQLVTFLVMARENAKLVNNNMALPLPLPVRLLSAGSKCLFAWKTMLYHHCCDVDEFSILDERIMAFRPLDHYITQKVYKLAVPLTATHAAAMAVVYI